MFTEIWLEKVREKGSTLCAGLDPAVFEMGRGEKGLPKGVSGRAARRDWCIRYLESVAPYCAAVKPNAQYWKDPEGAALLEEICRAARDLGLLVIEDAKLADIGATNDAGIFFAMGRAHGVTIAPFAGNMEETINSAKERDREFGIITMCLMSNPEYEDVKKSLIPLSTSKGKGLGEKVKLYEEDLITLEEGKYLPWYIYQVWKAAETGCDGIVVGAPSKDNHIEETEIRKVAKYLREDQVVLCPGVGAQGGEALMLLRYFDKERVIVNVGRGLMFPRGSSSTADDQREAARFYHKVLRDMVPSKRLRKK